MKNFIVGALIYTAMAVVAVTGVAAIHAFAAQPSPRQAPSSAHSPEQSSNNGTTTPRMVRSWGFNNCQYTIFEVDGHEYLQVMPMRSYAISLIHHAGCPCMKTR